MKQIEENPSMMFDSVLVVDGEDWNDGVIGIVASRLVELYGRPAIVISKNGETAKGSGRSIEGFSLYDALSAVKDVLTHFGGHKLAAGMGVKSRDIDKFRKEINKYASQFQMPFMIQRIDYKLKLHSINEQLLEIAETMVRSGAIDIVVVDSVAALVPKAEIDGEMGDSHVGLQARLMSQALRKLTAVISKSNCSVVFINQLREKVGIMFGNPETTTGGRALKFYSSVRMDVRRVETLKQGGEAIGNRTRVKVVKNKIAPPFKEAEFDIIFGEGISVVGDLLDLAAEADIINKSGAWYAYEGNKIGQGRENTKQYIKDHPELIAELDRKVREYYNLNADENVSTEN